MTEASLPAGLGAYLQSQAERRTREAAEAYNVLDERERKLVREAAVLGYVNGVMAAGGSSDSIPSDTKILEAVLLGARMMSDIHPTLGGLLDNPEEG